MEQLKAHFSLADIPICNPVPTLGKISRIRAESKRRFIANLTPKRALRRQMERWVAGICGRDFVSGTLIGRYYDSCSGAFTQVDPIQDGSNWYSYVSGNPINMTDPSGYFAGGLELPVGVGVASQIKVIFFPKLKRFKNATFLAGFHVLHHKLTETWCWVKPNITNY